LNTNTPPLRNHTHYQVAQKANAQTKTHHRVCLPQHTGRLRRIKHENPIKQMGKGQITATAPLTVLLSLPKFPPSARLPLNVKLAGLVYNDSLKHGKKFVVTQFFGFRFIDVN